nr:hypothetical protein [Luteibacter rhizovicinus]
MRSIQFVAGLFVFGLASIVIAGIDLYHAWEFRAEGKPARMELLDRQKPIQESSGVPSYEFASVRYKFADGKEVVTQRPIPKVIGAQLRTSGPISVVVLADPDRVIYNGETPDMPWVWLALSVASFATFAYALKLIKRPGNGLEIP